MLRGAVLILGGALAAFGVAALLRGWLSPALVLLAWGLLILLGTLYERSRYKPVETARPALDESPAAVPAPEQSPSQSADAVSDTSGEVDE